MKQFTLDVRHAAKEVIWLKEYAFAFVQVSSSEITKYGF